MLASEISTIIVRSMLFADVDLSFLENLSPIARIDTHDQTLELDDRLK